MKFGTPAADSNKAFINSTLMPDLKNWKPGQRVRVVVELEQTGLSVGDDTSASFKVLSARPQYGGGPTGGPNKGASGGTKPDKNATMSALQRKAAQ